MGQTNSNPVRLYTRFIRILKIIQYLGYFVVVFWGFLIFGFTGRIILQPLALVVFLLQASMGCGMIYVVTQALIAIVDLLSRIEQNTRP
jgi:4-hydroxybenzoate polyprenyltransferase